jgi:hypothetical protein
MKHLKKFQKNESILGSLKNLNPDIAKNIPKTKKIINEVLQDFEKYPNFKKMSINYSKERKQLTYVFGKYTGVSTDPHWGNRKVGDKRITFKWWAKTLEIPSARIDISILKPNKLYDPDFEKKMQKRDFEIPEDSQHKRESIEEETKFDASPNLVEKIIETMRQKIIEKYPQHKEAGYLGSRSIQEIENGKPITIRYEEPKTKDGKYVTIAIKYGQTKEEIDTIKRKIANTTKKEWEDADKARRDKLMYAPTPKEELEKRKKYYEEFRSFLGPEFDDLPLQDKSEYQRANRTSASMFLIGAIENLRSVYVWLRNFKKNFQHPEISFDFRINKSYSNKNEFHVTIYFNKD